ncbi:DUF6053 domain-containing protein [Lysobacter enzymogenes]|uniref:DUF6053 domain-containing protein n=1 Tax=Lysobacter enzymogenes TaxID=69 RepID=UPI003D189FBA
MGGTSVPMPSAPIAAISDKGIGTEVPPTKAGQLRRNSLPQRKSPPDGGLFRSAQRQPIKPAPRSAPACARSASPLPAPARSSNADRPSNGTRVPDRSR